MHEPSDFKLVGLIGGCWAAPDIDQQPLVRLKCWQVFELDNGDHLVGWHDAAGEGRVSSPLQALDAMRRQALTRSGRVYEVCGPEGCNVEGLYVWHAWLRATVRERATDVTQTFVRRIEECRP
ncbi:MAG: hypothetical protein H0U56_06385 [Methylibium sp.]|uniref:hypothetical protein n=1 Tax=Methylibium sp. TaxID=2067992 RepID=UPI001811B141|nr:hypothetical protein [Methylibium sp.]MBA2722518.1 hypothetical protein [Methylibium sp.]MBA3589067.1 hypothetical protein [Methylibium sp.]